SALFARLGFIECATPAEAAETLKMLIGTSRPLGRRAAIVVNSPAYAKISTDAARKAKLEVKELEPSITSYLKPFLTDNLTATNPLVLEIKQDAQAIGLSDVYRPFLSDKHDLAIFVGSIPKDKSAADQLLQFLELFADEALAQNLPCAFINTSSYLIPSSIEQSLLKRNVAILNGLEHGMRAVVKSVEFVEQMILMAQMPTGAIQLPEPSNLLPTIQLDEFDSKLVLRQIGVQIPNSILVEGTISLDLNEMVYPVVLKAVSSKMSRKTDVGALKLDLLTETQVRQAIFEMNAQVEALQLRGYLVEEMVIDGIAELYVGISNIPEIGLVLTLASGGILVELLQDVQTLILPASSAEIEATLRKLRLFPVLEGYRGHSAADVDLVVESISLMASHAASQQHRLVGLEVNPLIVRPGDRSPVAVDAVIRLGAPLQ
ncbi:MAG: acetate--CoA ligase family protein, partial [Chloroflexota bacterium]